jgi:hypothetical protein
MVLIEASIVPAEIGGRQQRRRSKYQGYKLESADTAAIDMHAGPCMIVIHCGKFTLFVGIKPR